MSKRASLISRIVDFYVEGFHNMSKSSKQLWLLILVKLFIMFAIWRLFFFPNIFKSKFTNDEERSDYMIEQLTKPVN